MEAVDKDMQELKLKEEPKIEEGKKPTTE